MSTIKTGNATIKMGNDEFILYIRKNYPKYKTINAMLGRDIWVWIRNNDPNATQLNNGVPVPTMWDGGGAVGADKLPQNATQFQFDRTLLVPLYNYLDALGTGINNPGNAKIQMGNDEFILYIRKNYQCNIENATLGKDIWEWIRNNDSKAIQTKENAPTKWDGPFGPTQLPKTATQFEFDRKLLVELYDYLDTMGTK
ncbi:hypothetical protein EZS27_033346 [termite gut metagenome]|uniref:Uncharacterized protein n=1 Tax=termite gut metagenome TaxID=433724 RepID=A0A5J4Q5H4_9ZZZZ